MPRPLVSVDVEASGPVPGLGDMVSFGAVFIEPGLERRFYSGIIPPTTCFYEASTYPVIGITREEHEAAPVENNVVQCVDRFVNWLYEQEPDYDRFIGVSDNPGFDFAWLNYWFHFTKHLRSSPAAPFGHSMRRIGDVYAGLRGNPRETQGWRKLRVTPHTHNPLDDAVGNAEAWLTMWQKYGPKEAVK